MKLPAEIEASVRPIVVQPRNLKIVAGICAKKATQLEKAGQFPVRVKIHPGNGGVGWLYDELVAWILSRPRGISGGAQKDEKAE